MEKWKKLAPGLALCLALAVPCWLLGRQFPVVGGPVFAILAGMVAALFYRERRITPAGITYTSKKVLQYAVILLGFGLGCVCSAALAVAASDDRAVNAAVGAEARTRHIPVSVADCPEECTFFFPAVCEGGELIAGLISRNGDHRAVAAAAKAVRKTLEGWK